MNYMHKFFVLLSGLTTFSFAESTAETPNIFVQDPEYFHQRRADLQMMQVSMEFSSNGFDSLLVEADKIAKMSDQCAVISLNDVMDESCWTFYRVDLPAFEEHYAKVTGEVRLGYMETVRGLQDRKLQIDACVTSLKSFVTSREENLFLKGGVSLEPLAKGFEANYDFTLQYEPNRRARTMEIAQVWGETCKDIVIRQDGSSFAPYFISQLDSLNQELKEKGSLAVVKTDSANALTVYVDIAKSVRSAYYLNGVKLFHTQIASRAADNSNLRITFNKDGVVADGETEVRTLDGNPVQFKGRVEYADDIAKVDGRWFWENRGKHEGVDFGPEMDEDSLATAKATEAKEQQIATENRKGLHLSYWVGITTDRIAYTDSSVCWNYMGLENQENKFGPGYCNDRDGKRNFTFYMPDIGAAIRLKYNFGPDANFFATAGAGAMFGMAFAESTKKVYPDEKNPKLVTKSTDVLKRTYGGLLGQFELGFMNFGIRETAIFHINIDDGPDWHQFRTGAFYGFSLTDRLSLNVELGYTYITNAGKGFYASVGTTF